MSIFYTPNENYCFINKQRGRYFTMDKNEGVICRFDNRLLISNSRCLEFNVRFI